MSRVRKRIGSGLAAGYLLSISLLLSGCVSEERIEEQWQAFVEENNGCETAADCAVVYPGCPLGCYTAVSADAVEAAEDEADRLVSRYERGGRACAYDCIEAPDLVCEQNRCGFAE